MPKLRHTAVRGPRVTQLVSRAGIQTQVLLFCFVFPKHTFCPSKQAKLLFRGYNLVNVPIFLLEEEHHKEDSQLIIVEALLCARHGSKRFAPIINFNLIFLLRKYCFYPYFTNEEVEARRRSHDFSKTGVVGAEPLFRTPTASDDRPPAGGTCFPGFGGGLLSSHTRDHVRTRFPGSPALQRHLRPREPETEGRVRDNDRGGRTAGPGALGPDHPGGGGLLRSPPPRNLGQVTPPTAASPSSPAKGDTATYTCEPVRSNWDNPREAPGVTANGP